MNVRQLVPSHFCQGGQLDHLVLPGWTTGTIIHTCQTEMVPTPKLVGTSCPSLSKMAWYQSMVPVVWLLNRITVIY